MESNIQIRCGWNPIECKELLRTINVSYWCGLVSQKQHEVTYVLPNLRVRQSCYQIMRVRAKRLKPNGEQDSNEVWLEP